MLLFYSKKYKLFEVKIKDKIEKEEISVLVLDTQLNEQNPCSLEILFTSAHHFWLYITDPDLGRETTICLWLQQLKLGNLISQPSSFY